MSSGKRLTLRLKEKLSNEKIEAGAHVYLHHQTKPKRLLRSVAIRNISPFVITWENNNSKEQLDLTKYLKTALDVVLAEHNLYKKDLGNTPQSDEMLSSENNF